MSCIHYDNSVKNKAAKKKKQVEYINLDISINIFHLLRKGSFFVLREVTQLAVISLNWAALVLSILLNHVQSFAAISHIAIPYQLGAV